MARISLLFSLTFVLALGSLFLTVSSQSSPNQNGNTVKSVLDKVLFSFGGYIQDRSDGRQLYVVASPPTSETAKEVSKPKFDKFMSYFFREKKHGRKLYLVPARKLYVAPATVEAWAPTGEVSEEVSQSEFDKFMSYFNNLRSHSRKLYTNFGFGGKGLFHADGKIKVAGRDGFKSLNRAHKNHFASREA